LFSFYFSAPKKRIFLFFGVLFFGVLFFGRKRHPHFRFLFFFLMAVKTKKESQYFG